MTQKGKLTIRRRHLPHWQVSGSVYYVTNRIRQGVLTDDERQLAMDHIVSGHNQYYSLFALIVMPDHFHVLLQPNEGYDLSRVMKEIKGVAARRINSDTGNERRTLAG